MKVGLDVGGTKIDAVVVDDSGAIVGRVRLATGWGADEVTRSVIAAVHAVTVDSRVGLASIESVGIGIPGHVEPRSGRVLHAVNLGFEELDLGAAAGSALGIPIRVENDVKAAALGADALRRASGVQSHSMAYLNLGTGVAAGIVIGGRLWHGARGTAGEVGHISVDPHGPLCACGQRGCVEALAGGGAVARRWGREAGLPVLDVFDAADAGDAHARELRTGMARGIAAAVRILVLATDVEAVVLGGGVMEIGGRLIADVEAELDTSAEASPFMRSLRLRERMEVLAPGSPVAALGAALIGASLDPEPEEEMSHG